MRRDGNMARAKKIEKEIQEAEVKKDEISKEIDVNEVNTEAGAISDLTLRIYYKDYTVSELIKIMDKPDKTYEEIEASKKFKLLMKNYYDGIMYAVLRPCCGKRYSLEDFKKELEKEETYTLIDTRCSRNNIRFDKNTVDTIVMIAEKYNLDK